MSSTSFLTGVLSRLYPIKRFEFKTMQKRRPWRTPVPQKGIKLKRGDMVLVGSGVSAGHVGRIRRIVHSKNAAVVEGGHMVYRRVQEHPARAPVYKETERPIAVRQLALFDPITQRRLKAKIIKRDGQKIRVEKYSGRLLPITPFRTIKKNNIGIAGVNATPVDLVHKVTYKPTPVVAATLARNGPFFTRTPMHHPHVSEGTKNIKGRKRRNLKKTSELRKIKQFYVKQAYHQIMAAFEEPLNAPLIIRERNHLK